MIKRVEYKNFKLLRDVSVDLEQFTLIAGPNSCGKTTLLQGIDFLARNHASHSPQTLIGSSGANYPVTHGADEFAVHVYGDFSASLDGLGVRSKQSRPRKDIPAFWMIERLSSRAGEWFDANHISSAVHLRTALLRLDPRKLTEPSFERGPSELLKSDGAGLPSVLATLAATAPDALAALKASVRSIIPQVEDFQISVAERTRIIKTAVDPEGSLFHEQTKQEKGYKFTFDTSRAPQLSASEVSEGVVLVIGVLAVLHSPQRPHVLLLDNLEMGLHPRALGEFVAQLRRVADQYPGLQVIATTHSPYLLDHFDPNEIRLMCLGEDGYAQCGTLTEHPDYDRWADEMKPGEFWSMVGEDWLKARPQPVKR